jgi:hypothetical protein
MSMARFIQTQSKKAALHSMFSTMASRSINMILKPGAVLSVPMVLCTLEVTMERYGSLHCTAIVSTQRRMSDLRKSLGKLYSQVTGLV